MVYTYAIVGKADRPSGRIFFAATTYEIVVFLRTNRANRQVEKVDRYGEKAGSNEQPRGDCCIQGLAGPQVERGGENRGSIGANAAPQS